MATQEEAPTGQGPVSASNCIHGNKDNQSTPIIEETVIIYRSWYECLLGLGPKKFSLGMKALLQHAFYGTDINALELPAPLPGIINTFTPIIATYRKKRNGGKKGAEYGSGGGRPRSRIADKTPMGLEGKTPMGLESATPMGSTNTDNDTGNDTETTKWNCVYGPAPIDQTHIDYTFFLPVFFFRNITNPEREAQKFYDHYSATNWHLKGGDYIKSHEQRLALAQRWEIHGDTSKRFREEDLQMWRRLYGLAPSGIKVQMVSKSISFNWTDSNVVIVGPKSVYEWLAAQKDLTQPIITEWLGGRSFRFYVKE